MSCARYQNFSIMTATQYPTNTVRCHMESCNGDYEAMVSSKGAGILTAYTCQNSFPGVYEQVLRLNSDGHVKLLETGQTLAGEDY